eukprot:692716_1
MVIISLSIFIFSILCVQFVIRWDVNGVNYHVLVSQIEAQWMQHQYVWSDHNTMHQTHQDSLDHQIPAYHYHCCPQHYRFGTKWLYIIKYKHTDLVQWQRCPPTS